MSEDLYESAEEFETLAAAIRGARRRAGLTQKEAAERLGVSQRGWQDWELGKGDPVAQLPNIEKVLGLPPGWFTAQLSVLERLLSFEVRLERIEEMLEVNGRDIRDVLGAVRLLLE